MAESKPLATRPKYDLNSTCDVVVGKAPNQKRFTVYTDVLTKRSEFFRAARSPEWQSDPTKPVDLEHEDPEEFQVYLNCAYFGVQAVQAKIELKEPVDDVDKNATHEDTFQLSEQVCSNRHAAAERKLSTYDHVCEQHWITLSKLWTFAHRLLDPTTSNLVVDEFIRFGRAMHRVPGEEVASYVYESTVHGSPLRRLIRDYWVYEMTDHRYMSLHASKLPEHFHRDIAVEYMRAKNRSRGDFADELFHRHVMERHGVVFDRCYYHQHDDKHPRCKPKPTHDYEAGDDEEGPQW